MTSDNYNAWQIYYYFNSLIFTWNSEIELNVYMCVVMCNLVKNVYMCCNVYFAISIYFYLLWWMFLRIPSGDGHDTRLCLLLTIHSTCVFFMPLMLPHLKYSTTHSSHFIVALSLTHTIHPTLINPLCRSSLPLEETSVIAIPMREFLGPDSKVV